MNFELTSELIGGITTLALVTGVGIARGRKSASSLADSEAQRAKLQSQLDDLNKDNERYTEALGLAKEAVTSLETQLREANKGRSEIEKQAKSVGDLEKQLGEKSKLVDSLQTQLEATGRDNQQLSEQLSTAQSSGERALADLKKQIDTQAKDLTDKRTQLQKLEQDLTAAKKAIDEKATSQADAEKSAHQKIEALEKTVADLTQERQSLQAEIDAKTSQGGGGSATPSNTADIAALTQARTDAQNAAQVAQAKVAELEKTVNALQSDKSALEEAMKISQKAIAALQQQSSPTKASPTAAPGAASANNSASTKAASSAPAGSVAGKSFVITGKLTQISNDKAAAAIEEAGGRINKMPSAKTDYIVVGENPGNKLAKAEKCNVAQLTEAQLIDLLEAN